MCVKKKFEYESCVSGLIYINYAYLVFNCCAMLTRMLYYVNKWNKIIKAIVSITKQIWKCAKTE